MRFGVTCLSRPSSPHGGAKRAKAVYDNSKTEENRGTQAKQR